jgi:hypothetical protein
VEDSEGPPRITDTSQNLKTKEQESCKRSQHEGYMYILAFSAKLCEVSTAKDKKDKRAMMLPRFINYKILKILLNEIFSSFKSNQKKSN